MSFNFHKRGFQFTLVIIVFLIPFKSFTQDLSGVWTGKLYNDTTHQYIPYELVIDESGGKETGYSQTSFDDGTGSNIGIKSQKIKSKNGNLKIEDEKYIYNNFPGGPPKGVKMVSEMELNENKNSATLTGTWKTNSTKQYRPLSGTVYLERKNKKPEEASIVKKMVELGMGKQMAFLTSTPDQNNSAPSGADIAKLQKAKDDSLQKIKEQQEIALAQKATEDSLRKVKEQEDIAKAQKAKDDSLQKIKDQEQIALALKAKEDSLRKVKEQEDIAKAQKAKDDSLQKIKEQEQIALALKAKEDSLRKVKEQEDIALAQKAKDDSLQKIKDQEQIALAQKAKDDSLRKIKEQEDIALAQKAKEDSLQKIKEKEAIAKAQKAKEESLQKIQEQEQIALAQKAKDDLAKQQQEKLLHAQEAKDELARQRKAEEDRLIAQKQQEELDKKQLALNEAAKAQKPKEDLVRKQKVEEQDKIQKANPTAAAEIDKRKIETIRTVEISQDSLVFSLYDPGVVDGDTVTVLINGKVIMPRVGLLATAINKTIYLTPEMGDSIKVVMYAENLGSIPPNTGLLVIREAKRIYEIRFSGDLQKNSAIILVRKKKE